MTRRLIPPCGAGTYLAGAALCLAALPLALATWALSRLDEGKGAPPKPPIDPDYDPTRGWS